MRKGKEAAAEPPREKRTRASRKPPKGPLEVRVSLRVKFGDAPDEVVTMMEDRAVPMVDSVFRNRDRIMQAFIRILLKAGMAQPRVARELLPLTKLLRRSS